MTKLRLISSEGRLLQFSHVSSFLELYPEIQSSETSSSSSSPFLIQKETITQHCSLFHKIFSMQKLSRLMMCNDEEEEVAGKKEEEKTTTTTTSTKQKQKQENNSDEDDDCIDFRSLHSAPLESLTGFAVWLTFRLQQKETNLVEIKKLVAELPSGVSFSSSSSFLKQKRKMNNNNNNKSEEEEEENFTNDILDETPQRVALDLDTLFPTSCNNNNSNNKTITEQNRKKCAENISTQNFCLWLVMNYSWNEISTLHNFSNFVGCTSLSCSIAKLIALHLRQVSATGGWLVEADKYNSLISSPSSSPTTNQQQSQNYNSSSSSSSASASASSSAAASTTTTISNNKKKTPKLPFASRFPPITERTQTTILQAMKNDSYSNLPAAVVSPQILVKDATVDLPLRPQKDVSGMMMLKKESQKNNNSDVCDQDREEESVDTKRKKLQNVFSDPFGIFTSSSSTSTTSHSTSSSSSSKHQSNENINNNKNSIPPHLFASSVLWLRSELENQVC